MTAAGVHSPVCETVKATLENLPEASLGVVYGSAATGRLTPESDVDVAVAADQPLSWERRMDWEGRLAAALGRTVDLLDLRQAHGPILREAPTPARLVFCRDRGLYAAPLHRMPGEQADFQPLLDRMLAARLARWTRP